MAPRSRRSAAKAAEQEPEPEQEQEPEHEQEEENEPENEESGSRILQFKQALIGRPGKPINVSDLLARFKTLLDELRTMDQDDVHRDSLLSTAQDLANSSLLHHKDAGVRAWTLCCIVDMLRLFAPDAPYPASKLKVGTMTRNLCHWF